MDDQGVERRRSLRPRHVLLNRREQTPFVLGRSCYPVVDTPDEQRVGDELKMQTVRRRPAKPVEHDVGVVEALRNSRECARRVLTYAVEQVQLQTGRRRTEMHLQHRTIDGSDVLAHALEELQVAVHVLDGRLRHDEVGGNRYDITDIGRVGLNKAQPCIATFECRPGRVRIEIDPGIRRDSVMTPRHEVTPVLAAAAADIKDSYGTQLLLNT